MSTKTNVDLGNIQKTLLLPLWGRAVETKKANPLLADKTAVEIISKLNFDFTNISSNINELTQTAWIGRSIITDTVLRQFMQKHPCCTVVNIGCGMDTTFERVDNNQILWYDIDMPDVIELRSNFIHETSRRKFISSSFLEKEWLNNITIIDNVIFIAGGVFYYFEEFMIKDFLLTLSGKFPGCEILFDAASPLGVKISNKKVIEAGGLDERSFLKWGLEKPSVITSWYKSIKILKKYSFFRGVKGLPFRLRFAGFISDLLKIMFMLHLKIEE